MYKKVLIMSNSELKIWIDGELINKSDAKVSVFDHGLLYGDGLFEGIRVYNGKVFLCEEHINRLYEGAHYINLEIPIDKEALVEALYKTIKANELTDAYVRLLVTRGVGDLGLDPRKCPKPSVIIIAASITLYPEELYNKGLEIITSAVPAIHGEALNPRVKSLNYMNNIMAKMEAIRAGKLEAIMLNSQGHVAECTGDNIFIIKNGVIKTPTVYSDILEGCTRNLVINLAKKAEIPVEETTLQRYDLYTADECFLTGSGAEVIAVIDIDGRKIGSGKPGPMTQDMLKRFREFIANY